MYPSGEVQVEYKLSSVSSKQLMLLHRLRWKKIIVLLNAK